MKPVQLLFRTAAFLTAAAMLGACGQRGPLYMPNIPNIPVAPEKPSLVPTDSNPPSNIPASK